MSSENRLILLLFALFSSLLKCVPFAGDELAESWIVCTLWLHFNLCICIGHNGALGVLIASVPVMHAVPPLANGTIKHAIGHVLDTW